MKATLYELLDSGGEVRIEIGGKPKYHYLTYEEIILLLDGLEALERQKKTSQKEAA
ncbi:MAG: hypothetical protein RKO66_05340 [Candidatus Contendobacter sp.]|nr:hypothetical protein [Candidatus Contendobacter sp.]